MQWIKATERQPEDWTGIVIRNGLGPKFVVSPWMVSVNGIRTPPQFDSIWRWDDFEWLDETECSIEIGINPLLDVYMKKDEIEIHIDVFGQENKHRMAEMSKLIALLKTVGVSVVKGEINEGLK